MKLLQFKIIYLFLCLGLSNQIWAQSLVDDANLSMGANSEGNSFQETIKIISNSKKIFILTNNNQLLGPGDFISLALENKLAARAVVGKVHQGQVGIKILKIYSMSQWTKLRRNQEVQIIRGDDSSLRKISIVVMSLMIARALLKRIKIGTLNQITLFQFRQRILMLMKFNLVAAK